MDNICYKKKSTPKEREECYAWFEQNMDRLPATLMVGTLNIVDLPFCVQRMMKSLKTHLEQAPIYEGQFSLLRFIQETLRQTPGFQEK